MRTARPDDSRAIARTLAAAFFDDPVQEWLFPDETKRERRLRRFFSVEMSRHYLSLGATTVCDTDDGSGSGSGSEILAVAAWAPPKRWRQSRGASFAVARAILPAVIGPRLPAALRLVNAMERCHPTEPHHYLGILGTHPDHQGRGFGSKAMQPILERCDRDAQLAYLESSKESNIAFYERHGFRVTGTIEVGGPPPLWQMLREPQGH